MVVQLVAGTLDGGNRERKKQKKQCIGSLSPLAHREITFTHPLCFFCLPNL